LTKATTRSIRHSRFPLYNYVGGYITAGGSANAGRGSTMLERMEELPDNVLGFEAKGAVTGSDYESVLIPAVDEMLARRKSIRFLYHLGNEFAGFDAKAMWDDAKVGLQHLTAWERVAVVTDVGWIRTAMKAFGFVMPGSVKVFGNSELAEARKWLSE